MAEADANLGTRLRQVRERRHLEVNELARRSGVNAGTISRVENGERSSITTDNLRKLADTLAVSTDYLLGRTDEETWRPDVGSAAELVLWDVLPAAP